MQPQLSMTKKATGCNSMSLCLSMKLLTGCIHPESCCHQEDTKHQPQLQVINLFQNSFSIQNLFDSEIYIKEKSSVPTRKFGDIWCEFRIMNSKSTNTRKKHVLCLDTASKAEIHTTPSKKFAIKIIR